MAVARQATEKPQATQAPAEREEGGFLDDLAGGIASVREKALGTLAGWARRVPGYGLLCVVLGRDPVTGAAVPRTAASLVGGFVSLIPGGQAMFENLQRAGAVDRAATWFADQVDRLGLTWDAIRGLFSRAWDALGVTDLLDPAGAWAKLAGIFGPPLERLRSFAAAAGSKVLEFVFEGVLSLAGSGGEQVMAIVRRAGDVLGTIVRDPIGFAGNLIAAVRGGLGRFLANIAGHLRTGLFAWLTGALRGAVALPGRLDWRGILGFALEVLGLTWAWVRSRLVRLIGEPVVRTLETAVDWVRSIVTGGLGAIADRILGFASGLLDTIIGGIRDWVANSVVGAAITRLLTMFNPAGAIIQAILAVYNTVQFFIERAQQLGALAASVFDSIGAIAAGSLGNAITAVEQAMARTLPVVLGFLARLLGLGDLATPVRNVINRTRTLLDQALDRVVNWIAGVARKLVGRVRGEAVEGGTAADGRTPTQQEQAVQDAASEVQALARRPDRTREEIVAALPAIRDRFKLTELVVVEEGGVSQVRAALNPVATKPLAGQLDPAQLHVPKAVQLSGRDTVRAPMDPTLTELALHERINNTDLTPDSFGRNIAVFKVERDGQVEYICKANDPQALHSEVRIIQELQRGKAFWPSNVKILQIYTERPPCQNCAVYIESIARIQGRRSPGPTPVYYSVSEYDDKRKRAAALMKAYTA